MVRWVLIGLMAAWGAHRVAAQPQGATIELRGKVVSLIDRAPVTDVDLRLVGVGPLQITQSGAFVAEIPAGMHAVQLTLVGDSSRAILYPVDGRLPVPNNERTIVTIVVDRSMRDILVEGLSKRFAQIEQAVEGQGQQYRASLSDVDSLLRRALDAREDEFQASVSFHKEKLSVVPPIMEAADAYVLEIKDMRDALRLVAPHAAENPLAVLTLREAMKEYNAAFTALNRLQNAAVSSVRSLWAGRQGERRAEVVAAFFDRAKGLHTRYLLSLNEDFATLQLAQTNEGPSENEVDAARQRIERTTQGLDAEIQALVRMKERLVTELDRPE